MFRFKLQPVLRYREWIEDEKKAAFAERQRILEREKAAAAALRENRELYFEALRNETAKEDVSVTFVNFYHSYIYFLERRIKEQDEVVEEARKALAAAHEELVEARKQREIMVKVREKALKVYKEEEARVEQLSLDDYSTIKHVRRQHGLDHFSN